MSLSYKDISDSTKVSLTGARSGEKVIFNVLPTVSESRNVNYRAMDPVHLPGQVVAYQGTQNRTFSVSEIKIVSRTLLEASINLNRRHVLESWHMPHFGKKESSEIYGPLGSPPEVLYFTAHDNIKTRQNIYRIPVVITSLNINYPSDVDYIEAAEFNTATDSITKYSGIPVPTVMTIELTLMEVHSPREFSNFSLSKFKQGKLTNF